MKKFLGFLLLLLISANAFSQANEQDINALSIFSEYVKAKNYDAAFEPWMELRERSPKFNSAIYVYGERILNDEKILGFIDKDGIFINKQNVDEKNFNKVTIQVFGWKEKFRKILSEIFIAIENYELEIVKITFSYDGFITIEEKDLNTIFLGLKPNLINYQLQIINNLKNEFKKNSFSIKIDNIDLTNPNKPKIKVFKP